MPDDFTRSTILETSTLREAMEAINAGGLSGVIMVNDREGKLVGLMTDGDIRRMLLSGAGMDSPIMQGINRDFTWVGENTSRDHVLDLIRALSIEHVPVLDAGGRLVGIHRLGEMFSESVLPNVAVIMAGGKGTRLGSLTKDIPKPMLKIAVNYLKDHIESHFGDGSHFGCEIRYLREDKPLGSGGALSLIPETPEHPVLVMNGDLVTDFPIHRLLRHHKQGGYKATMALSPYHHRVPFGCVTLMDGTITSIREKPLLTELVNAGIYVFSPDVLARVSPDYYPITQLLESCIENGETIGGYVIEENWADIGLPDELDAARGNFQSPQS
jgi:dTDP-glucose pyrophosphorylase